MTTYSQFDNFLITALDLRDTIFIYFRVYYISTTCSFLAFHVYYISTSFFGQNQGVNEKTTTTTQSSYTLISGVKPSNELWKILGQAFEWV